MRVLANTLILVVVMIIIMCNSSAAATARAKYYAAVAAEIRLVQRRIPIIRIIFADYVFGNM